MKVREGRNIFYIVRPVQCCELYEYSRNVIVLDPTLKIDEVDISYKSFIVQFSGLIINKIIKDKGWTITRAHNFLKSKFMFDQYVYDIMQEIVTERDVKIILNRNPTITFGSILLMKIRKIKPDGNDMTLAIPSAILPGSIWLFQCEYAGKPLWKEDLLTEVLMDA